MAKWGNVSLIRNRIVWFSDYKNPLRLYSHKPRIYPQGYLKNYAGGTSESLTSQEPGPLAKARAVRRRG